MEWLVRCPQGHWLNFAAFAIAYVVTKVAELFLEWLSRSRSGVYRGACTTIVFKHEYFRLSSARSQPVLRRPVHRYNYHEESGWNGFVSVIRATRSCCIIGCHIVASTRCSSSSCVGSSKNLCDVIVILCEFFFAVDVLFLVIHPLLCSLSACHDSVRNLASCLQDLRDYWLVSSLCGNALPPIHVFI